MVDVLHKCSTFPLWGTYISALYDPLPTYLQYVCFYYSLISLFSTDLQFRIRIFIGSYSLGVTSEVEVLSYRSSNFYNLPHYQDRKKTEHMVYIF